MKYVPILLIPFLVLLVLLGIGSYAFKSQMRQTTSTNVVLTNSEGRSIEAELLSKNGDNFRFRRVSDGKVFDYPMKDLSLSSRFKIWYTQPRTQAKSSSDLRTMHREGLVNERNRLKESCHLLELKLKTAESVSDEQRIKGEIEKAHKAVAKLDYTIAEFDLNSK